ncbi:MAG TPA: cysteine--tRNA ligase [Candidatus Saccharimonadales bacterium]|nr:cysteine--tRNA ligase [Candidatus Saccharimonadales bacterium]
MLKFYNSLTRQIDELKPIKDGVVSIYSCGPTVYDNAHIGNLRAFIIADTVARIVRLAGYKTKHVMNITDVDDKTIGRSQQEHEDSSPEDALKTLSTHYEKRFMSDIEAVGIDISAIQFIRATDSINSITDLIKELYKAGFAYIAEDGVYFSIDKYIKSGKTYGQLVELGAVADTKARINNDEYDKEDARDFALWKLAKPDEPVWPFELDGKDLGGRPGWHIECSAMSVGELGQPFDIHTGGIDLMFPHHENEIAQSTAGHEQKNLAKFFVHNEYLLVDKTKMSKSMGNFYTLEDILEHKFKPLSFRLFCLGSSYRTQADFTWENLASSHNRLKGLCNLAALQWQAKSDDKDSGIYIDGTIVKINNFLLNDLNTVEALAALSEVQNKLEASYLSEKQLDQFKELISLIDSVFGLDLGSTPDISADQKRDIGKRDKARRSDDFNESDKIRDQLKEQGIGLRDTSSSSVWFRL